MTDNEVEKKIIAYLSDKHGITVDVDTYLDDIGEDCDFTLMFELAKLFGRDEYCNGDEIGKYATVGNAVDAILSIL